MSEVPYVGCKISLISKSEIRYEGTLNSINSTDATVTLENVRSFGSEGRRGGNKEIQPSPQVYELIVFRGTDIKDLKVCEMPKQESYPSSTLYQPAVVEPEQSYYNPMGKYHGFAGIAPVQDPLFTPFYYESSSMQQQQTIPSYDAYSFPASEWSFYNHLPPTSSNYGHGLPHVYPPPGTSTSSSLYPYSHEQESPLHTLHDQLSNASIASYETAHSNENVVEKQHTAPPSKVPQPQKQAKLNSKPIESQPERRPAPPKKEMTPKPTYTEKQQNQTSNAQPAFTAQKFQGPRSSGPIKDFHQHQAQTEEFDFEKSNSRLQKSSDEASTSNNQQQQQQQQQFYTKKGFFDNISCEAKDRRESSFEDRRAKFQQEKATNMETFGMATSRKRYPYRKSKYSHSQQSTTNSNDPSTSFVYQSKKNNHS